MKHIFLSCLFSTLVATICAQNMLPKPALSYSQIVRLTHGENLKTVTKGLGLKKYCYNYEEGMLFCCSLGYHVDYKNTCSFSVPSTATDAYGISYCDAGQGGWQIVFNSSDIAEAYCKDFEACGYVPVFEKWQEFDNNEGTVGKYLEYIKDYNGEYCDHIYLTYNGRYYEVTITTDDLVDNIFWLKILPSLKDFPMDSLTMQHHNMTQLAPHTYGRNAEYNSETLEHKWLDTDAMLVDYSAISFTNKKLINLYLHEAKALGYQPFDSLGWKDIIYDGKTIGKSMSMYKNRNGIWGDFYGDEIEFILYDDYGCVMLSRSDDKRQLPEPRKPAVTIVDLELYIDGKITTDELQKKIVNAGQDQDIEIEGHSIIFKDKSYLAAYEQEAYDLGYQIRRENDEQGWYFFPYKQGPGYDHSITLHKGNIGLFMIEQCDENDFEISVSLYAE